MRSGPLWSGERASRNGRQMGPVRPAVPGQTCVSASLISRESCSYRLSRRSRRTLVKSRSAAANISVDVGCMIRLNTGCHARKKSSLYPPCTGTALRPPPVTRHRLNAAPAHGCDLAAATVFACSASQHNYERLGFQVADTKVVLMDKDAAADRPPGD